MLTGSYIYTQKWTDEYLQWDPDNYEGIDFVKLPSHRIWMPDIELYNTYVTIISALIIILNHLWSCIMQYLKSSTVLRQ